MFGVPCATKAVGCPHNTADLADLRRDECVVWQRAHTHRQVDVLVDEIECLVRERQMYVDLRELREALVDHRRDMETTEENPKVMFDLKVVDHDQALAALATHDVDLALIYSPAMSLSLRIIASLPQRLVAIVRSDHPLAAKETARPSECAAYPMALPDETLGSRQILDEAATTQDLSFNVLAESNSLEMLRSLVFRCNMISFQIEIDAPFNDFGMGLVGRPIDTRDLPAADALSVARL